MNTWVSALGLIVALAVPVAAVPQGDAAPTHEQVTQVAEFLFVQNASTGSFRNARLSLEKSGPIIFFSDRPYHIFGHTDVEHFFGAWSSGPDSFAENPPNAVLSLLGDQVESFVVVLSDPKVEGETISYSAKVDEGTIPETFGAASLFIDSEKWAAVSGLAVGRLSARRQQVREAAAFEEGQATAGEDPTTYYHAQAQPSASQSAPTGGGSTAEQQLAQLKDMLDKGLISQDDFDKKKQEILSNM